MNDLDAKIREALEREDNALEEVTRTEAGVWELFFSTMKGRNRFFGFLVNFWILVFTIVIFYSMYRYFQVEELRPTITWGLGVVLSGMIVMSMKVWVWMEMQKNSVLREVKRVELQLARLLAQMES